VRFSFRDGFYIGLTGALLLGLFLLWLWRPEHQLELHSQHLLRALEKKDWARFGDFISYDYQDQWANDRARVLERTREVFRYVRIVRVTALAPAIWTTDQTGYWQARITIDGDNGEVMALIKERVNPLKSPFRLEWHHASSKPWDWKLVGVSNPDLVITSEL
jgi:hypothetical protein